MNYHNFEVMASMCDILSYLPYLQSDRKRFLISSYNLIGTAIGFVAYIHNKKKY